MAREGECVGEAVGLGVLRMVTSALGGRGALREEGGQLRALTLPGVWVGLGAGVGVRWGGGEGLRNCSVPVQGSVVEVVIEQSSQVAETQVC